MKITHINPDSMLKNPAFSQAVMVEDAKKSVYIGERNGVMLVSSLPRGIAGSYILALANEYRLLHHILLSRSD
jgi:hypothetical protein